MITTGSEKIRPKDYEAEIQKLDDEPKSIYPSLLELPDREPKKRGRRAKYNSDTKRFEEFMESVQ